MKNKKTYLYDGFIVIDGEKEKRLVSGKANYLFNKENGNMFTWGEKMEEDAEKFPAPTILDFEITTICNNGCKFCYKSNEAHTGENTSFETFKTVFDKLPKSITQIAFGADASLTSNPDLFKMMKYARENGVIPNITLADASSEVAEKLSKVAGAVAVSRYANKNVCYDSIKRLTDRGMNQVNMHFMIAEETYEQALETIEDIKTDERLRFLNTIVFLSLKQKGRGVHYTPLSQEKFHTLTRLAFERGKIGFDSCSSCKFFKTLTDEEYEKYKSMVFPCESTLESSYISVKGEFFPCSFLEKTQGWETGIDVLSCKNFVKDVWNNPRVEQFRQSLLSTKQNNKFGCRECPVYTI